jgi:hypothetical protein
VGSVFPGRADVSFEFGLKVQPKIEPDPNSMHQCVTTDDVSNGRVESEARLAGKYLERLLEPTGKAGRGPVMMSGLMKLNKIQNKLTLQHWKIKHQNVATICSMDLKIQSKLNLQ